MKMMRNWTGDISLVPPLPDQLMHVVSVSTNTPIYHERLLCDIKGVMSINYRDYTVKQDSILVGCVPSARPSCRGSLSGASLCWGLCLGSFCRGRRGSLSRDVSVPGVSVWGTLSLGVFVRKRGLCQEGGSLLTETPSPYQQTNAFENITLPQTSFAGGNKRPLID